MKNYNQFIKENNFSLPTQKMIDWFGYSFNQQPDTLDELERDEFSSNQMRDFFDEFDDELKGLDYIERSEIFQEAQDKYNS